MKTEAQQSAVLTARTSGLSSPCLAVLTAASDPADPSTWTEAADFATTDRPSLSGKFGTVTLDDDNNKQYRTWPTTEMELDCPSGCTAVRLATCDGTGALSTAGRSVSDTAFSVTVPAGGKLKIPANSQTSSEQ